MACGAWGARKIGEMADFGHNGDGVRARAWRAGHGVHEKSVEMRKIGAKKRFLGVENDEIFGKNAEMWGTSADFLGHEARGAGMACGSADFLGHEGGRAGLAWRRADFLGHEARGAGHGVGRAGMGGKKICKMAGFCGDGGKVKLR